MKQILVIGSFYLKDGRKIIDENMKLVKADDTEIVLISGKRRCPGIKSIDFVTMSLLYGNVGGYMFTLKPFKAEVTKDGIQYSFDTPKPKKIKVNNKEIELTCSTYSKLLIQLKPRREAKKTTKYKESER